MQRSTLFTTTALLAAANLAFAADDHTVRAAIQPTSARKPAPTFRLADVSNKPVALANHHGKVVLLDFWATECGGCKVEIPWFMEFHHAYKSQGLDVVGVSMDILYENLKDAQEGWSRVTPFVQAQKLQYQILMGDDPVTRAYDIKALPATYLIDKAGRIAAAYIGLVDKANVEANIKTLLMER